MKTYLKYSLQKNNLYHRESFSGTCVEILANFLECEANPAINSYLEWATDPNAKFNNGNVMFVEKSYDDVVIGYIPEIIDDVEEKLVISRKKFIQILEDWKFFKNKRPSEIWIIWEGDLITVEGKN
jgi:hypothetical protein